MERETDRTSEFRVGNRDTENGDTCDGEIK